MEGVSYQKVRQTVSLTFLTGKTNSVWKSETASFTDSPELRINSSTITDSLVKGETGITHKRFLQDKTDSFTDRVEN